MKTFTCTEEGPVLRDDRDAVDVIAQALAEDAELVVLPVARLDERFFDLSTGIAGQILQKFVSYQRRLAIVGDISRHLERSDALRALVRESNRGRHAWFVADLAELDGRLRVG